MKNAEYARRIRKLRELLRLTQHALAELLHVRTPVVASWEQGRKEPSARNYRQLAGLAPPKDAWYFLERIGVTKQLVRSKLPKAPASRRGKESSSRSLETRIRFADLDEQQFVLVPLLRQNWMPALREITHDDIERIIAVPKQFLPQHSRAHVGMRTRGNSMAPVLQDGFLVIVDRSKRDPEFLEGQIVAVWGDSGPLFRSLNKDTRSGKLLLRAANPAYPTLRLDTASLIGAVVFWCGTPPP